MWRGLSDLHLFHVQNEAEEKGGHRLRPLLPDIQLQAYALQQVPTLLELGGGRPEGRP